MSSVPAPSLGLRSLLSASWSMLRRHPVVSAALGSAVVLSLASVLFGIGVIVAPWFVCEIFALQLAILLDRPTERTRAWVSAGLLALGMVGLVAEATYIALLAIGPDVSTADSAAGPLPWPEALERVALIATVTALTVGFIAPFAYAPLILIERGGRLGEAVLESAWLVRRGGLARHWALAFLAHLLPLAPAILAAVVAARTFERAATPVGVLIGLPLLPASIPLGQGLLSAAYVRRRGALPARRWTRREGAPPLALRVVLIASVLAPMLSIGLLAAGALRPAPPSARAGRGELVIDARVRGGETSVFVPDTTLEVRVDGRAVEIRAGDAGTGVLPAPWTRPIERVRVLRRHDFNDVELSSRERRFAVEVDRAGVRVDDSIGARLIERLPAWALPSIALAFALSALLLVRALEPLGTLRRAYGVPAQERPPISVLREQRRASLSRAWSIAAVLAPAALLSVIAGLYAVLA